MSTVKKSYMRREYSIVFIVSLVLIIAIIPSHVFAISEPAPGPSTITKYCSNGKCSSNSTQPLANVTASYLSGNITSTITLNYSPLIGIQLSKTCIKLEESNMSSGCITYDKLKIFDNINPVYYGQWINDTWYHRLPPMVKNYWAFADPLKKNLIMVDPDPDFTVRARMIYVTEGNFTWQNPDQNGTNGYAIIHTNRSVYGCEQAMVAPILSLINDTISYLESNCTITHYNDAKHLQLGNTPWQFDTVQMKQINWLSHFSNVTRISENCITKQCHIPSDPFHNHDKKFGW